METEYQVWVTLEKWQGDDKLEDVETCLLAKVKDEDEGRLGFRLAQDVASAAVDNIKGLLIKSE